MLEHVGGDGEAVVLVGFRLQAEPLDHRRHRGGRIRHRGTAQHPTNPCAAPVRHLTCRDSPLSSRAMAEIFEPSDGVSRELCRECLY